MHRPFKLPELGDNIEGVEIIAVLVAAGERVEAGRSLLEVVSDKAIFEIPADEAMMITEVLVRSGDRVGVGESLFIVSQIPSDASPKPMAVETVEAAAAPPPPPPEPVAVPVAEPPTGATRLPKGVPVPAAPSVRREARALGVLIEQVPGTGPQGRISIEDVRHFVKQQNLANQAAPGISQPTPQSLATPSQTALPDFTRWGPVSHEKMGPLRRATAHHLAATWPTIPQVTQFDQADITQLELLRKRLTGHVEKAGGGKLSLTAILLKIVAGALKTFPRFNASLDVGADALILKHYVHIGVAVDTPDGLIVPVIRDVDRKNITQIAMDLATLTQRARTRKWMPEEMGGGCFTLSNLGTVGGIGFTPIVNHPEVAILGVARSEMQARYVEGAFQPRLMLPLSLSYDHRVVDGADGARFLRWICEVLEEPMRIAL